jgi:hypothetical protein
VREAVYDTLLLSSGSVTRTDVDRAIWTCGWEIGSLYTFGSDPVIHLLPDQFDDRLTIVYKPKTKLERFYILSRVEAMIFIEPQDNPLSKDWLKPKLKKLTYHYHPELFPREQE